MDYTELTRVKSEMQSSKTTQDALLSTLITSASRAIDRKCTGVPDPDAVDYFKLEPKTGELLNGIINNAGNILVYPHKPLITLVSSFEYRLRPFDPWESVDVGRIAVDGKRAEAYPQTVKYLSTRCQVRISYTGGFAALSADLPSDLIEAATVLAIRYYKEAETGLSDAIGVAELATMVYTKAIPVRVLDMLQPYIRTVGWRFVA
jgi:hypothetical protein